MSTMTCKRFLVSGRVQGVFFREYTRRQAESLGLTGHAVNLKDGRVEVVACGDLATLDELSTWLRHGSPMARVDGVESEAIEVAPPNGFTTGWG
jgi:acylphosphatase